jgi:hypothetical protein
VHSVLAPNFLASCDLSAFEGIFRSAGFVTLGFKALVEGSRRSRSILRLLPCVVSSSGKIPSSGFYLALKLMAHNLAGQTD